MKVIWQNEKSLLQVHPTPRLCNICLGGQRPRSNTKCPWTPQAYLPSGV